MDLRELYEATGTRETTCAFAHSESGIGFEITLRCQSRGAIDRVRRKYQTMRGRGANQQPDLDWPKMREWLIEKCLIGWDSLTFRKALLLCNSDPAHANGHMELLDQPMPFTPANARFLLEHGAEVEDFVWGKVLEIGGAVDAAEDSEKKISPPTRTVSSTT